jgi:hypothetical protein
MAPTSWGTSRIPPYDPFVGALGKKRGTSAVAAAAKTAIGMTQDGAVCLIHGAPDVAAAGWQVIDRSAPVLVPRDELRASYFWKIPFGIIA